MAAQIAQGIEELMAIRNIRSEVKRWEPVRHIEWKHLLGGLLDESDEKAFLTAYYLMQNFESYSQSKISSDERFTEILKSYHQSASEPGNGNDGSTKGNGISSIMKSVASAFSLHSAGNAGRKSGGNGRNGGGGNGTGYQSDEKYEEELKSFYADTAQKAAEILQHWQKDTPELSEARERLVFLNAFGYDTKTLSEYISSEAERLLGEKKSEEKKGKAEKGYARLESRVRHLVTTLLNEPVSHTQKTEYATKSRSFASQLADYTTALGKVEGAAELREILAAIPGFLERSSTFRRKLGRLESDANELNGSLEKYIEDGTPLKASYGSVAGELDGWEKEAEHAPDYGNKQATIKFLKEKVTYDAALKPISESLQKYRQKVEKMHSDFEAYLSQAMKYLDSGMKEGAIGNAAKYERASVLTKEIDGTGNKYPGISVAVAKAFGVLEGIEKTEAELNRIAADAESFKELTNESINWYAGLEFGRISSVEPVPYFGAFLTKKADEVNGLSASLEKQLATSKDILLMIKGSEIQNAYARMKDILMKGEGQP